MVIPAPMRRRREAAMVAGWLVSSTALAAGCGAAPVLTQLVHARQLASDIHVEFAETVNAGNRAVMSHTDQDAAAAAKDAGASALAVTQAVQALRPVLTSLGYRDELSALARFETQFAEFRTLDGEILQLAVENSNMKAQRLSFGPAREAAATFRRALDAAAKTGANGQCCTDRLVAQASVGVLEILATQAPHIAESEDAAMTRMEQEMAASAATARRVLDELKARLTPAAAAHLRAADAALAQFDAITQEIVVLSRRNSNVRSLAMSLGQKRRLTAACEEHLRALEEALAKHEFTATR